MKRIFSSALSKSIVILIFINMISLSGCKAHSKSSDIAITQALAPEPSEYEHNRMDPLEIELIRAALIDVVCYDDAIQMAVSYYQVFLEATDINHSIQQVDFEIKTASVIPFQSYIDYEDVLVPFSLRLTDGHGHSMIISLTNPRSKELEGTVQWNETPLYRRQVIKQAVPFEKYYANFYSISEVEQIRYALSNSELLEGKTTDPLNYYNMLIVALYSNNYEYCGMQSVQIVELPVEFNKGHSSSHPLSFALLVKDNDNNEILLYRSELNGPCFSTCRFNNRTIRYLNTWVGSEYWIFPNQGDS